MTATAAPSNHALECLTNTTMAFRYRNWRGRSGRSYVMTVFVDDDDLPMMDWDRTLLCLVRVDAKGRRAIYAFIDNEHAMMEANIFRRKPYCGNERSLTQSWAQLGSQTPNGPFYEWHAHFLAESPQERASIQKDLAMERYAEKTHIERDFQCVA